LILLLVPSGLSLGTGRIFAALIAAVLLTVSGSFLLDKGLPIFQTHLGRAWKRFGFRLLAVALSGLVLLVMMALTSAELLVRRLYPQEVLGWGERGSLERDDRFGWKLKPSRKTRLRWESYDYTVVSNSLGFPGPEYPRQKPEGAFRILATGDAFTSAEGVDTDRAWPRLLEEILQQSWPGKVEVLNFAVTGYGPNQYARIVREFAPAYRPDLILIELFVNDFQDVLTTDAEFARSIGFDLPPQGSLGGILRLEHLQRYVRLHINEPLRELATDKPRPHGYFLGNFAFLEGARQDFKTAGREGVAGRLEDIRNIAGRVGARVAVIMVPAPVQVCGRGELAYFPRHINLGDAARFDLDLPQRMTGQICKELGLPWYDLRAAFKAAGAACPYQQHNMHWTEDGHRLAAEFLADAFIREHLLEGES